jgi:hypothetical protein
LQTATTQQHPSTIEVKVAIKKKNRHEHVKAKHGETVIKIPSPRHDASRRSGESMDSIREAARILGDLLPVEDILSEDGRSEDPEGTDRTSDELEELPNVSGNRLKPEDYSVACLAQELVKSRKELREYQRVVRKNMKILVNKGYILEDEPFRKVLQLILPMVCQSSSSYIKFIDYVFIFTAEVPRMGCSSR